MNIKPIALFICLSSISTNALFASSGFSDSTRTQPKKEMKTLINTNFHLKSWGISVSPIAQFGQMGNQSGIAALFHINNQWGIGMSAMSSVRKGRDFSGINQPNQRFGGLHLEYTPKANALVHVSFPLTIGMIAQEKEPLYLVDPLPIDPLANPGPNRSQYNRDWFENYDKSFGIQPGINVEVNLFKYAKLFGGVNYRFAFGRNATENIQGIGGQFGFKFGVFNKAIKK